MAKQLLTKWRESASLIILAKDKLLTSHWKFDYKVLLFNRTQKASFMPNSSVFPGGVHEKTDESLEWLEHLRHFGVEMQDLQNLTSVQGPRPSILSKKAGEDSSLPKELSLRITALRETFEEVGILLCRDRKTLHDPCGYGNLNERFDRKHWQHVVHNDHTQFLKLCRELDVVPDLWGLHEWSAWLTPANFPKRFQTAFYLVALPEMPNVLVEENEVTDFAWKTPADHLLTYANKEIWLPPPQVYELSRLLNIPKLDDLKNFACKRALNGITLMLPVQGKCTDGEFSLYPGDDLYPDNPNAQTKYITTNMSFEEYRAQANKLHRTEFGSKHRATLHLNFPPTEDHLKPLNFSDWSKL